MNVLKLLGWISGLAGVAVWAGSIVARISGTFWIGGFQAGTLLLVGASAMVFGCFCFLAVLVSRQ
jgi:hypothetical protein